jgi:Phosphotyrosine interaction domain (PTB/PID)
VKAKYVGCYEVPSENGINTVRDIITNLTSNGKSADISVSPNMVRIDTYSGSSVKCPMKDLFFLGMAKDVKICAFIMRKGEQFAVHVFYCEKSSLKLCRTIEAASKLKNKFLRMN